MMIGVAQVIGIKPTFRSFFSRRRALRERVGDGAERQELSDRRRRRGCAHRFDERAPRRVLWKQRAHGAAFHDTGELGLAADLGPMLGFARVTSA